MQQRVEATWALPGLPPADVLRAGSVADLLGMVSSGRRPFAGGTDLLVEAAQAGRELPPLAWTGSVPELQVVERRGSVIQVGAAATLGRIAGSAAMRVGAPALAEAASLVGSVQIRNVATAMGNLCNASPAADTVPPMVVHEAAMQIARQGGDVRSVAVEAFTQAPRRTALSDGEVATGITIRRVGQRESSTYQRFTVRNSMDLAFVGVAASIALEEEGDLIRKGKIALGAVGPTVIVAEEAAAVLAGSIPTEDVLRAAGRAAAAACRPITDLRASADYRLRLVEAMVGDVVLSAWGRARGTGV